MQYAREYARDGFRFYRVHTPQFFLEHELPIDDRQMTAAQRRLLVRLEDAAERHGTSIEASPFRTG
jgi:hypothetical protein